LVRDEPRQHCVFSIARILMNLNRLSPELGARGSLRGLSCFGRISRMMGL
jgi:hypothetical protein